MKVLNLPIKKQWFDMIECREKPEEYREIKRHWVLRLMEGRSRHPSLLFAFNHWRVYCGIEGAVIDRLLENRIAKFKPYTHILFRNGYSAKSPEMLVELKGITVGRGNPKWGAPYKDVFILHLGEIVERKNLKQ